MRIPAVRTLLVLLAAASGACRPPRELSLAERHNLALRARGPEAARDERAPSAAFARALRPVYVRVLSFPGPAASDFLARPTHCAAGDGGTVYLSGRRTGKLFAWSETDRTLRAFPAPGQEFPITPTAMAWNPGERLLYVLDGGANRVLKYRPDGTLAGEVAINSGQSGFALEVLGGGRLLVGGERWESDDRVTLLASYEADGRLRAAALPMDPAVLRGHMHFYAPVLLTGDGRGAIYAAEPTGYRWLRVSADGAVLSHADHAPQGYLPPRPRREEATDLAEVEAWAASWTPQVFLHAGDGVVFSGFEVFRPYHGYSLEVFTAGGEPLAGGLLSEARPSCGSGTRLYFMRPDGAGRVELRAYEYTGPRAPAAGGRAAD